MCSEVLVALSCDVRQNDIAQIYRDTSRKTGRKKSKRAYLLHTQTEEKKVIALTSINLVAKAENDPATGKVL